MRAENNGIQTPTWRGSRIKRLLAQCVYPCVVLLNRPSLSWFSDLIYDIALRCSGIAITFPGSQGLTQAEEKFLLLSRARLQGGVLFDIGANHGAYASLLAKLAPSARIFAFEPHPRTFSLLKSEMAQSPTVSLINKAVADLVGQVRLYDFRSEDGSTQASLSDTAIRLYSSDIVEHAVDCVTVDSFMAEAGIDHIDLLKIDTEGHDLSVLKGSRLALSDRKIGMIQFEFIPANIGTHVTMRDFFEVLQGYRIGRLCLNGQIRWLDRYDVKRCEIYVTQNLIAVPV